VFLAVARTGSELRSIISSLFTLIRRFGEIEDRCKNRNKNTVNIAVIQLGE
jgi:hypothetical protein